MKQLLEFLPLVIFFLTFQLSGTTVAVGDVVYTFDGIYSATIALISATFLQLLIVKLVWGAVEKRLLGVALVVTVFGSATVLLRDPVFIFWKPTVVNWVLAVTCVGWHVIRGRCLFEALLGRRGANARTNLEASHISFGAALRNGGCRQFIRGL